MIIKLLTQYISNYKKKIESRDPKGIGFGASL